MSHNEDAQPNEVRHARKGNARIPAIRSSRSVSGPHRRAFGPGRGRGFASGRGRGRNDSGCAQVPQGTIPGAASLRGDGPSGLADQNSLQPSYRHGATPQQAHWTSSQSTRDWEGRMMNRGKDVLRDTLEDIKAEEPEPLLAVPLRTSTEAPQMNTADLSGPHMMPKTVESETAASTSGARDGSASSASTTATSRHSTPNAQSSWSFDPRYPSLSLSIARRFRLSFTNEASAQRTTSLGELTASYRHNNMEPRDHPMIRDFFGPQIAGDNPPPISAEYTIPASPAAPERTHERDCAPRAPTPTENQMQDISHSQTGHIIMDSPGGRGAWSMQDPRSQSTPQWGCWAAVSSPLKFTSGVLTIGLASEPPHIASSPVLDIPCRDSPTRDVPMSRSRTPSVICVSPPAEACAPDADISPAPTTDTRNSPAHADTLRSQAERSRTPPTQNRETIQLRKDVHDKPRRLFIVPRDRILSVTMRGCFDIVERNSVRCSATSLRGNVPSEASRQIVDDACLVQGSGGLVVVLGHARNNQQVSLVKLDGARVAEGGSYSRPTQAERNGGVSAVCAMMQPAMFATGGYDHLVHLWTLSGDRPPTPSGPLAIKHTSLVQSLLATRDTSHKLVTTSADCSVNVYDLSSERVVNTLKLSNSVYHAHPAISEFCTLLEVAHRELQFELRDHRLIPATPVVRFGYPSAKVHGRYVRGAVHGSTFASGGSEKDGCVRLWDLRKATEVVYTVPCLPEKKVIQVAFGDGRLVACSEDHHLAFMDRLGDLVDIETLRSV